MPSIKVIIYTLFVRFLLLLLMIVYAIPAFIFFMLPARWVQENRFINWFIYTFYAAVLKLSLINYRFIAKDKIPKKGAIIIANHQSSFDIPVVGYLIQGHSHAWLALSTLAKSPILRFIIHKVAILVDMSSPQKGLRSIIQAIKLLNGNDQRHLIIFPEGGRYHDGYLHDFFAGYITLAKKTGRAIIPIYIHNLDKVYPRTTFWIHRYPVTAIVGPEFIIEPHEADEDFNSRVREWFDDQREQL